MKIATLDLGSNSFLLAIFEVEGKKIINQLHDQCEITRLSQGVDKNKTLHPEALQRAKSCLTDFKSTIDKHKVDKIIAVSTSAARDANNKEDFLKIGKNLGIEIQIIAGKKEAELTFNGATFEYHDPENYCVIDVGGGSTEIITRSKNISMFSFDVGSVRLTERFITSFPTSDKEISSLEAYIAELFNGKSDLFKGIESKDIIAVAGTPVTLMQMILGIEFNEEKIHKQVISLTQITKWRNKLQKMNFKERESITGLDAKRADVIVAGITILMAFLKQTNKQELIVSTKGVRYGLAVS